MTHILCPSCAELVSANALRCAHCRELLRDYRECPECLERIRAGARACPHCAYRFPQTTPPPLPPPPSPEPAPAASAAMLPKGLDGAISGPDSKTDYTIGATPLGGLVSERSLSALIKPAELHIAQGVITIRRWSRLGTASQVERLPVAKVGMVQLIRGMFSSGIRLESSTFGPPLVITGLHAAEAQAMVSLLEQAVAASRR